MVLTSCSRENQSFIGNDLRSNIRMLRNIQHLKIDERKTILKKAHAEVWEVENDSLRNELLYEISFQYYLSDDSLNFRKTNNQVRELSLLGGNANIVAMSYWDLAEFYHDYHVEDSAYYYYHKAQEIFATLDYKYRSAKLWLNMAIIQKNIKDYTGSEVSTIKAISLLEPLGKYKYLYRAYNNLGIIYDDLEVYEKALEYYTIAGNYLEKTERKDFSASLWNNIGVAYNNNKQYKKAAKYYDKGLTNHEKLVNSNPELYAMLIDNRAHNQFQSGDTAKVLNQYKKALVIRKENDIIPGVIISRIHLANYFLRNKDTAAAVKNASYAKTLARASLNSEDLLTSLMLLSKITKDSSLFYSREYIRVNDSLQDRERTTRNKFARIRYETAGYIAKTERLNERITKISLLGITGGVILILLFIIQRQRAKNKELVLIQEKNKRFEDGKEKEKQRISRELHDGVLAKLFGVSMSLDVLNTADDVAAKEKRAKGIQHIKTISEEIRLLSHELRESSVITANYNLELTKLIEHQSQEETKIQLKIDPSIDWEDFDGHIKINLYRILQEGLQNIHKHATAQTVLIEFKRNAEKLVLSIQDDGKGFKPTKGKKGIGLKNIKDRVKSLGGKLIIASKGTLQQGTLVKITIPILQKPN